METPVSPPGVETSGPGRRGGPAPRGHDSPGRARHLAILGVGGDGAAGARPGARGRSYNRGVPPDIVHFPFDRNKTEEATAYFLARLGGTGTKLPLIKYLYLADRAALAQLGLPICGGHYESLPKGPIISEPLDFLNGAYTASGEGRVIRVDDRTLSLRGQFVQEWLSNAEIGILNAVFNEVGALSLGSLLKLVHDLPEHRDPGGSTLPIDTRRMLDFQNVPADRVSAVVAEAASAHHYRDLLNI